MLLAMGSTVELVRAPYKRSRVIASQGDDLEQHIVTPGLFCNKLLLVQIIL